MIDGFYAVTGKGGGYQLNQIFHQGSLGARLDMPVSLRAATAMLTPL
jgi:hypothetical protein